MSTTPAEEALHQLQREQTKLLDGIDELRAIGVGSLVELPQLVVCGNQSSGKSSVLEAISRVRFPAKSNICTRFATEVILRRSPTPTIKISIEPGPSRKDARERAILQEFAQELSPADNDLPTVIEKAKGHMGVNETANSGFSDDVLKVEILGPDQPELTLVDLPGLYYSVSQDQSLQGIRVVRTLTEKYMKNKRSIILAVISAKADYHLQEVLNIAERFDPKRERTLGIITQPDTLEPDSEEEKTYLQFVSNKKIQLQLGWHVLRNRSFETRDIPDDARDAREKEFFNQGRWSSLSRNSVGIESLRRRLSSILFIQIRGNLPGLLADIKEKAADREKALSKLGSPRTTRQQQRGYLLNISTSFERITGQALHGLYADEFFGAFESISDIHDFRRLRAVIRQLNEYFADAMAARGSRRIVVDGFPGLFSQESTPLDSKNPYLSGKLPHYVLRKNLEEEVAEQARKNRGIELPGSANQLLVGSLFRDQSLPWEGLAKEHLMKTWESVRYFALLVMQHTADDHTFSLLAGSIIEPALDELRQNLLAKLDELTAYTKRGHPLPVGKSFLTQIQKARSERQLSSLKTKLKSTISYKPEGEALFSIKAIEEATSNLEMHRDEYAAADIIDQMQAYYDTAIVTFVDNVATLGIENCLLDPLQRILTSQVINNMHDDQVRELASEPSFTSDERDRLATEVEKLQSGLRTLKTFNIRKPSLSGPPSIEKLVKPRIGIQDIRPPVTGAKSTTQSSLFPCPQEVKTPKSQTTKPFPGGLTPSISDFTSKSSYYQTEPSLSV
ncbi:dynamin family protein [Aspergillus eucalypticola CBS 122712]|uniref:Dynamin family protein n=1 Tax=Aspergillus eucalypticola (strain CBS 122712 / IBT 29274) TaxID=1448314 RepID=A0A317ULL1_ASPEC|nr:dynamin family protein [Aspergillus eucalypticola CBS 122712]PWY62088.1 dynamin family protein [Aspergillus eucalypticola CBS 122712]